MSSGFPQIWHMHKAGFLINGLKYFFNAATLNIFVTHYELQASLRGFDQFLTQSWLKAMLHSLVAQRRFRPQTQ